MINKNKQGNQIFTGNRYLAIAIFMVIAIVLLAIFQDYLLSLRNGYSFYFYESLLFKALWFFFPPILFLLKYTINVLQLKQISQMCVAALASSAVHLLIVPLTIWCLSAIFREQSYGFYKTLTFTLSNDLVKILLIYGLFILLLKYLEVRKEKETPEAAEIPPPTSQYLTVSSGKNKTRVQLDDILYIKAATPYVAIQLENKEFLHAQSLKSIGEKLDSRFIRIHRSYIVNIDKVLSHKSRLNGDYDLMLQDGTEIRLSRNYAPKFKQQFESKSTA